MYLSYLSAVALVPALVVAVPQPADHAFNGPASVRVRDDKTKYPASQPVPQLLKDNPDLFYWPVIKDTDGVKPDFVSPANQSDGIVHPESGNWFGTGLFGYDECKKRNLNKAKIDDAYYDMWYLTNRDGIYKDIDWNSAAAFEFLGPPANNEDQREQIQRMLKMAAGTSKTWGVPAVTYIHVRCDDPAKQCTIGCNPDGTPKESSTIAYTQQSDNKGYTSMNFCPRFFDMPRLRDAALDKGKGYKYPLNLDVKNYDNTARVFLHELLHADYFMVNDGSKHVYDLNMQVESADGSLKSFDVYGPTMTKIMAKFQPLPNRGNYKAGYYVEKNADNMAWFATAKYVQDKTGTYPHLPIVYRKINGPPIKLPQVTSTYDDSKKLVFNLSSFDTSVAPASDTCVNTLNPDGKTKDRPLVELGSMAPDNLYSDAYNKQRAQWIADLEKADTSPSSTTTAGSSKPTCSGNQVQGDCVTNVLPSAAPFSGPQAPSCAKADGSSGSAARLNKDKVAQGASDYCEQLAKDKVLLGNKGNNPKSGIFKGQAENGKDMVMTVMFLESACPTDKKTDSLDFTKYDKTKCMNGFSTTLAQVCAQDSTWNKYNKDFTLMGGVWGNDCALWSLQSQ